VDEGFCCEKCSLSLPTFEKWQIHRGKCNGTLITNMKGEQQEQQKKQERRPAEQRRDQKATQNAIHKPMKREIGRTAEREMPVIVPPMVKVEREQEAAKKSESESEDDDLGSISDIESEPGEIAVEKEKGEGVGGIDPVKQEHGHETTNVLLNQLDSILNESDDDEGW